MLVVYIPGVLNLFQTYAHIDPSLQTNEQEGYNWGKVIEN
jgi:hypothetical protein